jgi:hypothetical protein
MRKKRRIQKAKIETLQRGHQNEAGVDEEENNAKASEAAVAAIAQHSAEMREVDRKHGERA